MPELPEAETIARQLRAVLPGLRVRQVRVLRPDVIKTGATELPAGLTGRTLQKVNRRGKRVELEFDGGRRLLFALGMTGQLLLEPSDRPAAKHTHLCLTFGPPGELRFRDPRRFGRVWLLGAGAEEPGRPLGPDAIGVRWSEFRRLLARRRQIKALLLDQTALAGMGNIYTDEALHRAGIHPLTPADRLALAEGKRLLQAIRQVLRQAIRRSGTTISDYTDADGQAGGFQFCLRVYGRVGQPCPVCGTTIRRIAAAGRSTYLCPRCQRRRQRRPRRPG